MFSLSHHWQWLPVPTLEAGSISRLNAFDIPNEIWTLILLEPSLELADLLAVFTTCHHFNNLVLPILLFNSGTKLSDFAAGRLEIFSDMLPVLKFAFALPRIDQMTCLFDVRGDSAAPQHLRALTTLLGRTPSLDHLRLKFQGDLLSAYHSDLVPLAPQRRLTAPFCNFLAAFPRDPNSPVVFVSADIFTCRAADIQSWRLDSYSLTDTSGGGVWGFLSGWSESLSSSQKNPLRTKTLIKHHNGRSTAILPFVSISYVLLEHIRTPFSAEFSSWTLVVFNAGSSSHWPNSLSLSAPLTAEEWAAILPRVTLPKLPMVRMDTPQVDPSSVPNIPAPTLDAFLARHSTLTRLHYYPDPHTLPGAPPFPRDALPRLRNLTTTARGLQHLLHAPESAFLHLFVVRITGQDPRAAMVAALRLLSRHTASSGIPQLKLEVSSGSWMDPHLTSPSDPHPQDSEDVLRALHRVDTVILFGHTDFVDPRAILKWLGVFPALRRVGLQNCLHPDVEEDVKRGFAGMAREALLAAGVEPMLAPTEA